MMPETGCQIPFDMRIVVNGEPRDVPESQTVLGLIESLGLNPSSVAVELDRAIVKPPEWATPLSPGACVEIVHFVGGG